MTSVSDPAPTFSTKVNEDVNRLPGKAFTPRPQAQGDWEGWEVQFLKVKVLVRWLRRLEVLQLILAWDVRKLSPEEPGA